MYQAGLIETDEGAGAGSFMAGRARAADRFLGHRTLLADDFRDRRVHRQRTGKRTQTARRACAVAQAIGAGTSLLLLLAACSPLKQPTSCAAWRRVRLRPSFLLARHVGRRIVLVLCGAVAVLGWAGRLCSVAPHRPLAEHATRPPRGGKV